MRHKGGVDWVQPCTRSRTCSGRSCLRRPVEAWKKLLFLACHECRRICPQVAALPPVAWARPSFMPPPRPKIHRRALASALSSLRALRRDRRAETSKREASIEAESAARARPTGQNHALRGASGSSRPQREDLGRYISHSFLCKGDLLIP